MRCPTCGTEGDDYGGPPRAEQYHFYARALWSLHKLRQALEAQRLSNLAAGVSAAIRYVEMIGELMLDDGLH